MRDKVFKNLGASSHCREEREQHDYYATDPKAINALSRKEKLHSSIWESACGEGHLSKALIQKGYNVFSSDLFNRGYGETINFLTANKDTISFLPDTFDIVTNPPFTHGEAFIFKALKVIPAGRKVCMFLKLLFLEGQSKQTLFYLYPPLRIHIFSKRIACGKNGVFPSSSAVCYAWFIWQKKLSGKMTRTAPKITWIT